MPKELDEGLVEQAEEWNMEHPAATEIVVTDGDRRLVGIVQAVAQAIKDVVVARVRVYPKDGDPVTRDVPITSLRPRAIERRKTSNMLHVELTDEEMLDAGATMADAQSRGGMLEADLATYKKQVQADIEACKAVMAREGERLRAGYEVRSVECELVLDFDTGKATETRKDTEEVVTSRDLYPEEIQRALDLVDAADEAQDGPQDEG